MKRGEDIPMMRARSCGRAGFQTRVFVRLRHLAAGLACAMVALAASAGSAQAVCAGDCNGDGRVAIAELQACVNLAAGLSAPPCAAADADGDGTVEANEVDACVLSFLDAATCPMVAPTPTQPVPTATNTVVPTATAPPTNTPVPTATPTVPPTLTLTPTVTLTPTIALPTATFTATPFVIGSHACVLGTGSVLGLNTQALPLMLAPSGSLQVDCGTVGADGTADCSCSINSLNPVVIPAIGDVCVNPTSGCDTGTLDCDGGAALDTAVRADHNLGSCASNAACQASCATHCDGLGANFEVLSAGCEGFCQGGSSDETACTQDTQCPGGTCVGNNPVGHPETCNCVCQGTGLGTASAAGDLSCQIGLQIDVQLPSDGDCDPADTTPIRLAPLCGAVTTAQASGQIVDANNTAAKLLPLTQSSIDGAATTCSALAASTTTGISLVGHLAFFDSTLGDIFVAQRFNCQ